MLQLGTACPDRAVKAAKLCEADIAGVDVNMGKFEVGGVINQLFFIVPEKLKPEP